MGKEMRLFYIAEAGLLLDTNRELMIRKLTSGYKERLSLRCSCRSLSVTSLEGALETLRPRPHCLQHHGSGHLMRL